MLEDTWRETQGQVLVVELTPDPNAPGNYSTITHLDTGHDPMPPSLVGLVATPAERLATYAKSP